MLPEWIHTNPASSYLHISSTLAGFHSSLVSAVFWMLVSTVAYLLTLPLFFFSINGNRRGEFSSIQSLLENVLFHWLLWRNRSWLLRCSSSSCQSRLPCMDLRGLIYFFSTPQNFECMPRVLLSGCLIFAFDPSTLKKNLLMARASIFWRKKNSPQFFDPNCDLTC